jgi:hypothetical protein
MMRGERVLMPVRRLAFPYGPQYAGFVERLRFQFLEGAIRSGGTMMPTVRGGVRLCVTVARSYLAGGFPALATTGQAKPLGPLPRDPESQPSGQGSRPRDLKLWC